MVLAVAAPRINPDRLQRVAVLFEDDHLLVIASGGGGDGAQVTDVGVELVRRNGGLEGTRSEQAYFVRCDRSTMTQTDIDQGRLICLVGVAPVKPAEFVIVRIGLWTAHADV